MLSIGNAIVTDLDISSTSGSCVLKGIPLGLKRLLKRSQLATDPNSIDWFCLYGSCFSLNGSLRHT